MYQPCSSPDPGHFSGCNLEIRAWKKRAQISMPVGWRGPKPASTHFHGPAWCGQKERPAKLRKSKLSTLATTSITFEGPSNSNLNNLIWINLILRDSYFENMLLNTAQYKYMKLLLLSITYYYYIYVILFGGLSCIATLPPFSTPYLQCLSLKFELYPFNLSIVPERWGFLPVGCLVISGLCVWPQANGAKPTWPAKLSEAMLKSL